MAERLPPKKLGWGVMSKNLMFWVLIVLVSLVFARAGLDVGRGGIDRRHDRSGRGIRRLPRVDAACRESALDPVAHASPP